MFFFPPVSSGPFPGKSRSNSLAAISSFYLGSFRARQRQQQLVFIRNIQEPGTVLYALPWFIHFMLIAIPWNKYHIHLHFTDVKTEIHEIKWLLVLIPVWLALSWVTSYSKLRMSYWWWMITNLGWISQSPGFSKYTESETMQWKGYFENSP